MTMTEPRPVIDTEVKCWRCGRKLAESLTRPWFIKCNRCHAKNMNNQPGNVLS